MAEETKQEARPAPEPVPVDETSIAATYANFCRVTGTPEELIVDFGLNKQVVGNSPDTIQLNQRIIVNFFTAKRLAAALMMAVQRHEQAFGVLETDVQKTCCYATNEGLKQVLGYGGKNRPSGVGVLDTIV